MFGALLNAAPQIILPDSNSCPDAEYDKLTDLEEVREAYNAINHVVESRDEDDDCVLLLKVEDE